VRCIYMCLCTISFGFTRCIPFQRNRLRVCVPLRITYGFERNPSQCDYIYIRSFWACPFLQAFIRVWRFLSIHFAGYLIGFLICCSCGGKWKRKDLIITFQKSFIAFLIGHAIILTFRNFVVTSKRLAKQLDYG